MITSMADLQALVKAGEKDFGQYGRVTVKRKGDLLLFNYVTHAMYSGEWNWFETASRGLILDTSGTIIARPFDKFFNWGEGGRTTSAPIKTIWEKLDGSLGIAFYYNGLWHVTTRGSFDSDQALWATAHLNSGKYDVALLDRDYTYLFEIIYPQNRIVVDYGGFNGLVLLAARHKTTGDYMPLYSLHAASRWFGFKLAQTYHWNTTDELVQVCAALDATKEGFVVEFEDGQRFKFKGAQYLLIHRQLEKLTYPNMVEAVQNNTFQDVYAIVPEEHRPLLDYWYKHITSKYQAMVAEIDTALLAAPKDDDTLDARANNKQFAAYVTANHAHIAPFLFARRAGKPYSPDYLYKVIANEPPDVV